MLNKKFFLIPFFSLMVGCSLPTFQNEKEVCNPSFFMHYEAKKGEIVGIGVAPPNFYGFNAQKRSAISKALNEIAAQMGVTVNNTYVANEKVVNHSRAYSSAQTYTMQTINGKKVNARIVKECKAADGNYYVLMKAY